MNKFLIKKLTDYGSRTSLGFKMRKKRIAPLVEMINEIYKRNGRVRIIDIGGTRTYWNIVGEGFFSDNNVKILILNLPGTENPPDSSIFEFANGDGCDLKEYEDSSFDIVHSNSVIEHVGDWERMVQFANESRRLGKNYFVQTPNYWFPIEPHCLTPFFHWLPKPSRIWLIRHFSLGNWNRAHSVDSAVRKVESARLLNKAMFSELFFDSQISIERLFLLPKSFIAIRVENNYRES